MRLQPLAAALLIIGVSVACAAEPDDCPRDLSGLDLGWQGDPPDAADAPAVVERPASRREARRARRASRAWWRSSPEAAPPSPVVGMPLPGEAGVESVIDRPGVRRIRDLPYVAGGHARQRFDLFLPGEQAAEPFPLVIWIHGTTWRDGSKDDCPVTWLVGKGYAVASIGYRLTDTAVFPAQLEDCLQAFDHLQASAATWHLDPSRFAIAGSAAGGHLAALVGLTEERGGNPLRPNLRGVCVVSAPTLLTSLGPAQDRAGSPASLLVGGPLPEFREAAQRASPLTHVSSDAPPFLIIHARGGDGDAAVPIEQSRQFDEALRAAGAASSLIVIERQQARSPLADGSKAAKALVEFLDRSFDRSADD